MTESMRRINKSRPPQELVQYRNEAGASFGSMDRSVKEAVQTALLNEQGWVCGYCQQRIKDIRKMSIEHHCEQSICNGENGTQDLRLDYRNLMAVCGGDSGNGTLHCDKMKACFNETSGLPMAISPWNDAHMAAVSYSTSGLVKSSITRHNREMQDILNLNAKHLKKAREERMRQVFANSKDRKNVLSKQKMKRLLEKILQGGPNKFVNSFPGLTEYMLRKYCS